LPTSICRSLPSSMKWYFASVSPMPTNITTSPCWFLPGPTRPTGDPSGFSPLHS
jgi:hypothetical protein